MRNRILTWLEEGKTYAEIIKLVVKAGQKISKGGIFYIKNNPKKQNNTEQTEQTEQKKKKQPVQDKKFETAYKQLLEKYNSELKEKVHVKLLSDLEFSNFENSLEVVFKSNLIRLKTAHATGILNALIILYDTCKMIKKRGKYQ